jgi:hypothetical protein
MEAGSISVPRLVNVMVTLPYCLVNIIGNSSFETKNGVERVVPAPTPCLIISPRLVWTSLLATPPNCQVNVVGGKTALIIGRRVRQT